MRKKKVCAGGDTRRLGCVLSCCQLRSYKNTFSALTWLLNSICLSGRHPPPPPKKTSYAHFFRELCWGEWGRVGRRWAGGALYSQLPLSLDKTHKSLTHMHTHTHTCTRTSMLLCREVMGSSIWAGGLFSRLKC